jgi:hypothetical protein
MILEIATNIDNRVKQMESIMDKRIEELKQAYLSDSAKVRTLENNMTEFFGNFVITFIHRTAFKV